MIYLDNAATTKPSRAAVDAMLRTAECFGNPSSLHGLGLDAEKIINKSKKTIADILSVNEKFIYFTSGGTEANNTAIFGTAYDRIKSGKHLITTKIEHPSVLEAFKRLEKEGFDVTYLTPQADGRISLDELSGALREDTTLVSVMHVNNETGVIQPIDKIKPLMKEKSPKAVLHCDCVQSFGKIDVKPQKWGIDMISISAHKIHGFKGAGALYASNKIKPLIYGGEQQNEVRPGTENIGGIAAFAAAAEECKINSPKLTGLRGKMLELLSDCPNIKINGSDEYNSGSVLNVSFIGIKAEILLHALEAHKIYVSTGSACSSHKPQPSHVLTAMGLNQKEINGAIRISFDESTSEEEIETAAEIIKKETANIRRYMQ